MTPAQPASRAMTALLCAAVVEAAETPERTGRPAAADTTVSITSRRSSVDSAAASPIVPVATKPEAP